MSGLLMPVQYGAPSSSYQDDESLCSSRQGLIRSQRSSTVSFVLAGDDNNSIQLRELNPNASRRPDYGSTTAEERTALKSSEDTYQESQFTTIRLSTKRLLLFSVVLITLLVLSSIFTATIIHILSSTTCTSISCVTAAQGLHRKSSAAAIRNNPSPISPCDDFYEYACAGWAENSVVRSTRTLEWNVALETSFHSFDKITTLFARLMVQPGAENLTTYQSGALLTYQKCMTESIEDANAALQIAYKEMNGWLSTSFDDRVIEKVMIGAYRTNAVPLFHISAQIDAKDIRSHTVLTIEEAVPYTGKLVLYGAAESFDAQDLLSGRLDKHWLHTLIFSAGLELGKELEMTDNRQFRAALAQAILLDYKLARCSPHFIPKYQHEPPEQWRTTVGELKAVNRLFDFRYFLREFIGKEVTANTEIVIAPGREYFDRVMSVLKEYSSFEGQLIIKDYIKFKQLFMLSIHSGKLMQSKELGGLETLRILYTGEDDRSLQCINKVAMINQLGFASILERFWSPQLNENIEYARKIGESMRREYISALQKSDVIDEVDRAAMIEKADRIRIRVAVPEAARNNESLFEESEMIMNETFPWAIFFTSAMGNKHWKQISNYGKPVNPNEWPADTNPFNINVHYNYESNSILFPIIWSMEQFVDSRLPSFVSFAGFGSILGHEMTHAFDFKGRNFGPSGVDRNLTIGRTSKNFEAKQTCFQEQYTALGEMRATDNVLAENLADNVALAVTFKAWNAQDELGKKILPGMPLTSNQAFFTSYAQNWCSLSKGASGSHSLGKLRVLGPLQNSREFSEAFSCPVGSFMNPVKKCALW